MAADAATSIDNIVEETNAAATNGLNVADSNALWQAVAAEHINTMNPSIAASTAEAALGMFPALHVPPFTDEQFAAQATTEGGHHHHDAAFNSEVPLASVMDPPVIDHQPPPNGGQLPSRRYSTSSATPKFKPTVGSEEWHRVQKNNHKEVERRRRETINEGINELAKIVPGCEKTRGSILRRAVSFVSQLTENEQQYVEKWTLEKLLTEQALTELSDYNNKLKQECERLHRELDTWKRVAQSAGLEPPQ